MAIGVLTPNYAIVALCNAKKIRRLIARACAEIQGSAGVLSRRRIAITIIRSSPIRSDSRARSRPAHGSCAAPHWPEHGLDRPVLVRGPARPLCAVESLFRPVAIPTSRDVVRSDQRSRKVRASCSSSGLSKYCSGVRSWVWMKTSAGMPGTRRMSFRRATSSAGSEIRTV